MPLDLGRPLALRVLAYKLQAQQLGDLDKASLRELSSFRTLSPVRSDTVGDPPSSEITARQEVACLSTALKAKPCAPRIARPGTVLTREYGGALHRVVVLDAGVSWNGKTYDSLSKVALAITGTKWNGPRFFGLRGPTLGQDSDLLSRPTPGGAQAVMGRGRARYAPRTLSRRAPS